MERKEIREKGRERENNRKGKEIKLVATLHTPVQTMFVSLFVRLPQKEFWSLDITMLDSIFF